MVVPVVVVVVVVVVAVALVMNIAVERSLAGLTCTRRTLHMWKHIRGCDLETRRHHRIHQWKDDQWTESIIFGKSRKHLIGLVVEGPALHAHHACRIAAAHYAL